jgi:hypothetical protein
VRAFLRALGGRIACRRCNARASDLTWRPEC